jgi:hypothetical protein
MVTARQVQFRRGTAAQNTAFTGAPGEVTVNTDTDQLHVHDGVTPGGHPLAVAMTEGHYGGNLPTFVPPTPQFITWDLDTGQQRNYFDGQWH